MDATEARAARAARRRATWQSGRVKAEDARDADLRFWAEVSGEARLQAIWGLAMEAYADTNEIAHGLRGSPGGIRKR